jgi:AraC-like DNA-binding protein
MLVSAAPGALSWPAALVVWGPGYTSSPHRHHSIQLLLALRGQLRIRPGSGRPWATCDAALVRPDASHEVDARTSPVLIAFVEPESELGAALLEGDERAIAPIEPSRVAAWRVSLGDPAALDALRVETWVRRDLLRRRRPTAVHPRVRRVLRFLRSAIGEVGDSPSLDRLAAVAGLSRSRFMHAFTASVGVPLRPYIRWLRLQRALADLMGGATVTEAAHGAGFSDAAHLSRTVRHMLGTTPSELARRRPRTHAIGVASA